MKSPRLHFMFLLLALIVTWLLLGAISQASATTYEVGVNTGDWAQYTVDAGWRLMNGTAPEPQGIVDANNTRWINMTVQSFTINTVTMTRITQFNNGTKKTATLSGNIETGKGSLNYTVIAADLNVGDTVVNNPAAEKINITKYSPYANVQRETNYSGRNDTLQTGGNRVIMWRWDKLTGILDELYQFEEDVTPYYDVKSAIHINITGTNMWEGGTTISPNNSASPIDPTLPIVGGATVVAAILAVYAMTQKSKSKRTRTRRYSPKRHV